MLRANPKVTLGHFEVEGDSFVDAARVHYNDCWKQSRGQADRQGASIGWLGRTFRGNMETRRSPGELEYEIQLIHKAVDKWKAEPESAFVRNRKTLIEEVESWAAVV